MSTPLRVLIVEGSRNDMELLLCELRRAGYTPYHIRVETAKDMQSALGEKSWDIVLSDFSLPRFSATDALATLKKSGMDIPFILISGAIGEETAAECMRAGAHDFVMKGKLTRLVPTIERELREAQIRRERTEAVEGLHIKNRELDLLNSDLHDLTMEIKRIEETERKRFAELLHDNIGQKLVAIKMALPTCKTDSGLSADKVARRLKEVNTILSDTIHSIRIISSDLCGITPYEDKLISKNSFAYAATWYVENVLEPAGLRAKMEIDDTIEACSNNFKLRIYRILQESLQNVVKHASASSVVLLCKSNDDHLIFSVKDDGVGMPLSTGGTNIEAGVGLRLMRERVKSMKGQLTIRSAHGQGTEVAARFPMEEIFTVDQ